MRAPAGLYTLTGCIQTKSSAARKAQVCPFFCDKARLDKREKRNKQTQFSVANKVETISTFGCCSRRHACHVLLQCNRNTANRTTWCHKMGPATLIKWDPVCWIWSDSSFAIQPENFMWLWKTCFPSTNSDLKMRCTLIKTNCVVASDLNHGCRVVQKKMIVQLNATLR